MPPLCNAALASLLGFFLLLAKSALAEPSSSSSPTVPCPGSSLQIDPTRPNNVIVAGLTGPGSARYQLVTLEVLGVKNPCAAGEQAAFGATKVFPGRPLLITRCEECTKCPLELPNLHRILLQVATDAKLSSLLVILGKDLDRALRPSPRQADSLVKFVFSTDEDPGLLTFCEPSDPNDNESLRSFSKTSVLFVSISFIILIVISLAWLVFYYVQRFRYAHAKDRLQRRLFNAAKKALARIPTRPVKAGDKELSSDCPVCIDPYKPGDICRQLPCRHIFHKSCVDPWLLEHRTCPMCKSDILKAFGYHVSGRRRAQFSANVDEDGPTGDGDMHREGDRMSIESTGSESANPFPVVTEVHDPFGFSPSVSPHLVQVINTQNFQVVPMTTILQGGSADVHQHLAQNNPHCEIIQTPIERHEHCDEGHTAIDVEEQPTKGGDEPKKQQQVQQGSRQSSSGGLRLFRAVTGRRHVNANLVQIARSRSFSQSQISPLPIGTNAEAGAEGTAKAIIYSVNGNPQDTLKKSDEGGPSTSGNSRAVTAPGGFRRKVVQEKQQPAKAAVPETRVDMSETL